MPDSVSELQSTGAWQFFQDMLRDMTTVVTEDAESEREFVEGLRVIARISSLCAQLSVEADPDQPSFFDMCTPTRMVGGPNPDGNYYLAMIRGDRSYRITGHRGTSAYLGLQILAGTGLTPRRMAGYVSDVDLALSAGQFELVLSEQKPAELDGAQWVQIPSDASSVVVREYIGDRVTEQLAVLDIAPLDPDPVAALTDSALSEQLTAMAHKRSPRRCETVTECGSVDLAAVLLQSSDEVKGQCDKDSAANQIARRGDRDVGEQSVGPEAPRQLRMRCVGVKRRKQQRQPEEADVGNHMLGRSDDEGERPVEGESHSRNVGSGLEKQAHRGLQKPRAQHGQQDGGQRRLRRLGGRDGGRSLCERAQVGAAGRSAHGDESQCADAVSDQTDQQ
jgi:hypothetical protein